MKKDSKTSFAVISTPSHALQRACLRLPRYGSSRLGAAAPNGILWQRKAIAPIGIDLDPSSHFTHLPSGPSKQEFPTQDCELPSFVCLATVSASELECWSLQQTQAAPRATSLQLQTSLILWHPNTCNGSNPWHTCVCGSQP